VKPVLERGGRMPAELDGGERGVDDAAPRLARPSGGELCLGLRASPSPAELVQLEPGGLDAGADVEDPTRPADGGERGARHVADVDVVARLEPVAEDPATLACREPPEEDRHDSGPAV